MERVPLDLGVVHGVGRGARRVNYGTMDIATYKVGCSCRVDQVT